MDISGPMFGNVHTGHVDWMQMDFPPPPWKMGAFMLTDEHRKCHEIKPDQRFLSSRLRECHETAIEWHYLYILNDLPPSDTPALDYYYYPCWPIVYSGCCTQDAYKMCCRSKNVGHRFMPIAQMVIHNVWENIIFQVHSKGKNFIAFQQASQVRHATHCSIWLIWPQHRHILLVIKRAKDDRLCRKNVY